MAEMTPETFLRELGTVREGVHQSVTELKTDLRQVVAELRRVSDTMLTIQAQDVAGQLSKLKETEIGEMRRQMAVMDQKLLRAETASQANERWLRILVGAVTLAIAALGIWVEWKH